MRGPWRGSDRGLGWGGRSREAALRLKAGDGMKPLLLQVDETAALQKKHVPVTNDEDKYVWDQPSTGKVRHAGRQAGRDQVDVHSGYSRAMASTAVCGS